MTPYNYTIKSFNPSISFWNFSVSGQVTDLSDSIQRQWMGDGTFYLMAETCCLQAPLVIWMDQWDNPLPSSRYRTGMHFLKRKTTNTGFLEIKTVTKSVYVFTKYWSFLFLNFSWNKILSDRSYRQCKRKDIFPENSPNSWKTNPLRSLQL